MKYLRLFKAFFKASLIADLEFRMNFVTRIVTDIFWYFGQIATFKGLFLLTPMIGTWKAEETMVFLGVLFVVDAIYMILFSENLDRLADRVTKGDLDLLLTKPANSQFMISFQRMNTAILGNLLIAISWLAYSISQIPNFQFLNLLWLIFLIPTGVIALYSVRFIFGGFTIIFTRAENLQYLFFQLYRLGMRPDSIYSPWMRIFLMTLLPVGIIASVPARFLMNPPDYLLFAWSIAWSLALVYISHRFWNFCLKFYSSASS
jgi:ABC-2 type transport system permease protein